MFITLVFPKLFQVLSPFIFALIVTLIVNSVVKRINRRVSLPTRLTSLALSLLVLLAIIALIVVILYVFVQEIIDFSLGIQQNWGRIVLQVNEVLDNFDWLINILPPQIIGFFEGFEEGILESIQDTSRHILESTVTGTASIISRAGSFMIKLFTFFLAWYFITSDYTYLNEVVQKNLNDKIKQTYLLLKISIVTAFGAYFKAQITFALLAFIFMFIALIAYGQQYSFLLALFLGFIDLLPIIGTIAILLPWGIFEFLAGDVHKGLFLIIIGIVYFIIRRLIEPKIMGSHTGLHPLLALMSIYLGLQLLGVWGAVLGPVIFMLIISIAKSGIFDNTVADIKELLNKISKLLSRDNT